MRGRDRRQQGRAGLGRAAVAERGIHRRCPPLAVPQGGIDEGEDAEKAARRELYEETSIRSVSLITAVDGWLTYDLPEHLVGVALKGKYRGQKQRWFLYGFEGEETEINVAAPPDGHDAEFDEWAWMAIEDVPAKAVAFKVDLYRTLIAHLRGETAIRFS